jgi:hypothetical protein
MGLSGTANPATGRHLFMFCSDIDSNEGVANHAHYNRGRPDMEL